MRKRRVMKRVRVISLLLCVVMVFGMIPVMGASAAEEKLTVSQTKADLPKNGSVELTASCAAENTALAYQWQILVPGADLWVDISGENGASIKVTYAMVANLLSDSKATLRAKSEISGETVCTDEVTITVTEPVAAVSAAPATTFALKKAASSTNAAAKPVDLSALKAKVEEAKAALDAAEKVLTAANDAVTAAQTALNAAKAPAEETQTESVSTEGEQTESAPEEEAQTESTSTGKSVAELEADLTAAQTAQAEAQTKYNDLKTAFTAAKSTYELQSAPAEEESTTYNVVINYLFENNEIAADPYTASLAAGSNFSATVTFPTVQGYLPYVNEVQQNSIALNYASIGQDYTINVVYKPTNVNYTVIHYQQNLSDDNYTEKERETKQGLTNSTVPEVAKKYEGFYALLYEKPAIAADGSTVVEVYYDRYYYLMNFDLDGGYGTEPIYARFGTPISGVNTPTKAGYSFGGWSLNGTPTELPGMMPAENRTYKAIWTANDTAKVTVVFWGENADDEEYSYIKSTQINVKPGTEFAYSEDGTLICALEVHTHDLDSCYKLTCGQDVHTHSEECYTCGKENHTHSTSCYAGVGSVSSAGIGAPNNPQNGYVAREVFSRDGKVIYINGTWYKYTGSTSTGNIAPTTCGKVEENHTHTDTCLGCGKTEHTHSVENGCYMLTCTKQEHTHTSDCYMNSAGLDSNLWTFVKSDTVTVAADGSSVVNVYYDRTMFTVHFRKTYSNSDDYGLIYEKWGANIRTKFNQKSDDAGTALWSSKRDGNDPWTSFLDEMPSEDRIYYANSGSGNKQTATYYGESLDGDGYVVLYTSSAVYNNTLTVSDEDKVPIKGFTYDRVTGDNTWQGGIMFDGAKFYYTRNSYTLTFNNGYDDVRTESVKYEAPLGTYSGYVPDVPSAYEPGSVTFGGWYLNPECTGAEYELDGHTMPADNVLLYAKWVPVTHTVEFYLDRDALDAGTRLSTHPDITVAHGSLADPTPAEPTNGSYTFVGWFYMEDGVEKAFDFANMPVNKDLKVYGKWSSNVLKPYTIYYKIQGTDTEIADPTNGSGLAGITKTFEAKGGSELYPDYQEGYFPMTKSHSMTLDINATEENDTNVYTFWYVEKPAVPYTVHYYKAGTTETVHDDKVVNDNKKAVVTETFVPVSGMMPDAYQKRLVVSAEEGAVNEIIFYYTEDTTHAYYKITHYTENLAKDDQGNATWTEYASSQAVGDIGTIYTADPMTIPGFTYDSTVAGTVASGELTTNGLELKLYYTRNSYPYQVRYLEQGTGKQLADTQNGSGKFGQVISETAISIDGYDPVAPTSQTLNIRIEESDTAKLNIITFYYTEKEVTINYVVVGPDGCGTVTPASETLKVKSGTASGSTAAASSNVYRFVGWFADAACTTPVDTSWVTDGKITPAKGQDGFWTAATYCAKFEYNLTDMKIKKEASSVYEEGEKFVFDVVNADGSVSFSVTAAAGEEVTIKDVTVGDVYTITERSAWSWRYSVSPSNTQEITIDPSVANNVVTFTNTIDKGLWLSGTGSNANHFSGNN